MPIPPALPVNALSVAILVRGRCVCIDVYRKKVHFERPYATSNALCTCGALGGTILVVHRKRLRTRGPLTCEPNPCRHHILF